MITQIVATYDDGTTATFVGTPAVPAVPATGVDLSTIPTQSAAEIAELPSGETSTESNA